MTAPIAIEYQYLLEDECEEVIQFSPIRITWKAYDRTSALVATAVLLAQGISALHYQEKNAWLVQANF